MSVIVNIHEAKTNFSKLVEAVHLGDHIIIARSGKPIAQLVPLDKKTPVRQPGSLKGKITISEDFDAALPADIVASFEGE